MTRVRIAIVGLNFGASFVPIYQNHPDVERVAVCDADELKLNRVGDQFEIADRFTRLDDVLHRDDFNAVHLLTPVPLHVEQTLNVLAAEKHCACAVPMATDLNDLQRIIEAQRTCRMNYMMMETAVYTREFLFVRDLHLRGELGMLTFMRGSHIQDLEGNFPAYWRSMPPMHYATHAIAPLLALARTRAEKVVCFGSGRLRADIQQPDGNTFPLQAGIFQLADTGIAAEVTRSWFQTARSYTESFGIYGDARGFEWQQLENEEPLMFTLDPVVANHRGRHVTPTRLDIPFRPELLPASLSQFARGAHGGSHPHLVHEFVRSIVEERSPAVGAATAANWTAPGICANSSSIQGGQMVVVPQFR